MEPLTLRTPLTKLSGVGKARAAALENLGLFDVGDLLTYFPREYEDRTVQEDIAHLPADTPVCFAAMVAEPFRTSYVRRGMELTKGKIVDATGQVLVTFFNQNYVRQALHPGQTYYFYGKLTGYGARRQMVSPKFEPEGRCDFTGGIFPVYPLTAGISNHLLTGLVRSGHPLPGPGGGALRRPAAPAPPAGPHGGGLPDHPLPPLLGGPGHGPAAAGV